MKVRCIHNTGEALRSYENKDLSKEEFGRFGVSSYSQYGVEIGKEYLVMGMLIGEGVLSYLIDDGRSIMVCPHLLFDVIDSKIYSNWFFRSFKNTDDIFPYQEAVWGYYELVFDDIHYEKLMDFDGNAHQIYYRRKIELEKESQE